MPLRPEELERELKRRLAPVYLIAGEEPLFVQEALDAVRAAAKAEGYTEREVLDADSGFDWGRLGEAAGNLSLFGERRLIELRLPTGKPGATGAKAITAYCQRPPQDVILLIACNELDSAQRRSGWAGAAEKAGAFMYAWPLPLPQLPNWISARLRRSRLSAPPQAVALLAERAEGNLLAAGQEIEKLRLLYGERELSLEEVATAVGNSARYTVYDLAEAATEGALARCVRVLRGLKEEGGEPVLVLWALSRELRALALLAAQQPPAEVFREAKIFSKPQQARLQSLARRIPAATWQALLAKAARTDRVNKGIERGRPWDELLHLATSIARAVNRP
jgi:DNA polymerase-3 subunit delta